MSTSIEKTTDFNAKAFHEALEKENFYTCLVLKKGNYFFEYFRNPFHRKKLQKLNSCTKSFVSALVGIAIEKKYIPGLETPIVEYFPSLKKDKDPRKSQITIEHLLTMSAGFDWPEFGEWNYNPPMLRSEHWVQFVLDRPMKDPPGKATNYNTGCSQLLTAILHQVTGDLQSFAEKHLFEPLNISNYRWQEDPQGIKIGGYGLHLQTADIAKFGQMYLDNGVYNQRRVINEEWIRASTTPRFAHEHPIARMIGQYACHWWCTDMQEGNSIFFSIGFGGQILIVAPKLEMVVVMTGDNYSNTLRPLHLFKQYLV